MQLRESMNQLLDHSKQRDLKVDEMYEQNKEMFSMYKNANTVARAIIWLIKWSFTITLAIAGAYVLFKKILLGMYN